MTLERPRMCTGVLVHRASFECFDDREGVASAAECVAFSPDGRRIVSGSADRTLRLWDATTGREISTLTGHSAFVRGVAFSPDGRRIASVSGLEDMTIRVWDASERQHQ